MSVPPDKLMELIGKQQGNPAEAAPSMQYRVSGIKSFNPRQVRKESRMNNR